MCSYIRELCLDVKEGYKKPHGMSSANAGLAFNIIGITRNRNSKQEYCEIMINPEILDCSKDMVESMSNCGSINLEKPIKIKRYSEVKVGYFNENGEYLCKIFDRENGSLTIQHEIDHNLGILITDRV
jgi:peptide deformylase